MKKLMRLLLVVNLVIANSLCASAGSAGTGAAQSAKSCTTSDVKQGSEQIELPRNVVLFLSNNITEFNEPLMDWLRAHPEYLNAVDKESRETLLMLTIEGLTAGVGRERFRTFYGYIDNILSMNPNVLTRNELGEDALEILIGCHMSAADKKPIGLKIGRLMVQQGADLQKTIEFLVKKRKEIQKYQDNERKNRTVYRWEEQDWQEEDKMYRELISFFEHEQYKGELAQAREVLTSAAADAAPILPKKELSIILAASNPHILAIKHAIEDNDEQELAEALQNNTWLELADGTGYTPFLYAAYINKPDMMHYLIQQGANVDAKTKDGVGATYFGDDYQKLINDVINEMRLKKDLKNKALQELLEKLGQSSDESVSIEEYIEQLREQMAQAWPFLTTDQQKQLGEIQERSNLEDRSYSNFAPLAELVSKWLKESK